MGTKAKFYVATSSGWVEANFGGTGNGSFYGVSNESSTTRTATLTNDDGNFELVVGATVNIKFEYASSSGSMTLNVNNTGAKTIKQNSSNTTEWKAGAIINLVYDGSNWIVSGVGSTVDTDKKTASTPSNEKLYLIGSTAQGTDGQATYSNSNVYTKNGVIYANGVNTSSISSNSSIAFYAGGGGESSIEYSNISGTGVISNGHFISYGDDDNSNENKPANKTDFTDLDSYYFNTGITLYDSDSSRKYKLSFPAKSGTFATLDDTKIEAGTGLKLSGTTFSANLNSETSLGTIGSTFKLYPVGVDASGKLAVSVPWTDTNTDTHYTNYLQIKGNGTEAIKFTQNADKSLNFKPGNNVSISAATNEITISANVPTKVSDLTDSSDYALKSDITNLFSFKGSLASISNLPTSVEPGEVYNISSAFTADSKFPNDNGKSFPAGTNVVYVAGNPNNYWEVLGGTYSNATTTTDGLMSSGDKSKLEGIADNANNYTHPATHPASMITGLATVATSGQYSDLSGALTLSGNGSATTAARSDHNHNGVYSPIGHTHSDYITSAYLGQNYYTKSEIDDDFATANHTHNFQYLTNRGEAFLNWGGTNVVGSITPLDTATSNLHSANRFAFANPAGITIEKSTDGGNTWVDYGTTDNSKIALVSGIGANLRIGGKTSGITINDKLRITLNATNMYVYTRLLKLLLNISTEGATGSNVKVERAMKGSETTFSTIGTYDIAGWSGWNSIPMGYAFGGDSTQTYNVAVLRLTFGITGLHSTYPSALTVYDIVAIGDTYWSSPSTMAKTGHLYDYDYNKNANFPANVSATTFTENGTNLYDKYAAKSHNHSGVYSPVGHTHGKDDITGPTGDPRNEGPFLLANPGNSQSTYWIEKGDLLSGYLPKTAKAADADKLDGNDSTYYLNYNNLTNLPPLGTVASKNTGTSSGNIPILDSNGKLADSVIPAVAITDTYVVNTEAAMLALSAQKGDIAIRSDLNKSFVLQSTPASTLANWKELLTPTDTVLSVNNKKGAVTLNLDDINDGSTRKLANYLPLSGGNITGDLALYAASGNSPRLTFQRGTLTDAYNDWSLYDSSGYLYIQQRGDGSAAWETRAEFTQSGVNFIGTIYENGTSLANKYQAKGNYAGSSSAGGAANSANKLNNLYSSRPTSANLLVTGDGSIKTFKATSSMTTGKPMNDGHIIHSEWDNTGGYSTQLYIPHDPKDSMQYRGMMGGVWWDSWRTLIDSESIGSQSVSYATTAGSASSATKATQDGNGRNIVDTYALKSHLHTPSDITGPSNEAQSVGPFLLANEGNSSTSKWVEKGNLLNGYATQTWVTNQGYSKLTLGTTSSTAAKGNHIHSNILTTAPTSANTTGEMKFVVLSSEPTTKYDGYLYIITG